MQSTPYSKPDHNMREIIWRNQCIPDWGFHCRRSRVEANGSKYTMGLFQLVFVTHPVSVIQVTIR